MDIRNDIEEIKKSVSQLQSQFGHLLKMVEQSMSIGFSEAYTTIKQKVENIDTENKEVRSKVDIIEQKVERVEEKTERIEQKTEKIEQKVEKSDTLLRKELEETKKRMRILENTISSEIRKQVASILQEITRTLDPFVQKISSLSNSAEIIEEYNQLKDKFEKSYGIKR